MNNKPANGATHDSATVPPARVRAYMRAFGICAVAVTPGGVKIARDIARIAKPLSAHWTTAANAVAIKRRCDETNSTDVCAAAAELHIGLTPHDVAVARAAVSIERMEALLAHAKDTGALQGFNRAYKLARKQARAQGRHAPTYGLALHRLKVELYKATSGVPIDGSMIARALGIKSKHT